VPDEQAVAFLPLLRNAKSYYWPKGVTFIANQKRQAEGRILSAG